MYLAQIVLLDCRAAATVAKVVVDPRCCRNFGRGNGFTDIIWGCPFSKKGGAAQVSTYRQEGYTQSRYESR